MQRRQPNPGALSSINDFLRQTQIWLDTGPAATQPGALPLNQEAQSGGVTHLGNLNRTRGHPIVTQYGWMNGQCTHK